VGIFDELEDTPIDGKGLYRLLTSDDKADKYRRALQGAIEKQRELVERGRYEEYDHIGIEPSDCNGISWVPNMLQGYGIFIQTYNSNSSTYYRLGRMDGDEFIVYADYAEQLLELADEPAHDVASVDGDDRTPLGELDVDTLFTDVVGYETYKKFYRRTLGKQERVHHLLWGEPGSGKSMMLDSIVENVKGARRAVLSGNQTSAQGIVDMLKVERPPVLVVEEIEKGSKADREALMTLCGSGYIQETKADGRSAERMNLDTIVFAAGNDFEAITPPSLRDRFLSWEFEAYNREEFVEVCEKVLPRDIDVAPDLAAVIARTLHDETRCTSVRIAEKVGRLAETEEEVKELVPMVS
jgi:hypothetical protein